MKVLLVALLLVVTPPLTFAAPVTITDFLSQQEQKTSSVIVITETSECACDEKGPVWWPWLLTSAAIPLLFINKDGESNPLPTPEPSVQINPNSGPSPSAPVPEPSTLVLGLLGLAFLIVTKRRLST